MRGLLLTVALAGCGRLGFDQNSGTDALDPDAGVAPIVPDICNERLAGMLDINGEQPTKVRATRLSNGYAVAIETAATNVYVVRVDANGNVVSLHTPMSGGYQLHGISQIQDRPFVYVFTAGAGYIKMLTPDWNSYDTGPSGEELPLDPQQALLPGGTGAVYGVFNGGQLKIGTVDMVGSTAEVGDYAPLASTGSFAATPTGARVVVEDAGTCETFAIAPDGTTGGRHSFSPCSEPLLAMLDDETGAVLYLNPTTNQYALHAIPVLASNLDATLEQATNPRIVVHGGAIWIAYLAANGGAKLVRYDGVGTTTQDYPTITTAFDLLGDAAFWANPDELRIGDPCVK